MPGAMIRLPGHSSRESAARLNAEGIPLSDEILASLMMTAREVGVRIEAP